MRTHDDRLVLVLALGRIGDHVDGLAVQVDFDLGDYSPGHRTGLRRRIQGRAVLKRQPVHRDMGRCAHRDGRNLGPSRLALVEEQHSVIASSHRIGDLQLEGACAALDQRDGRLGGRRIEVPWLAAGRAAWSVVGGITMSLVGMIAPVTSPLSEYSSVSVS